jgi:hypothetical protein
MIQTEMSDSKDEKSEAGGNGEVIRGLDDSVAEEEFVTLKCVVDGVSIPVIRSDAIAIVAIHILHCYNSQRFVVQKRLHDYQIY